MRKAVLLCGASVLFVAVALQAQDSQSLGEIARKVRLQKQQKEAQSKQAAKEPSMVDVQFSPSDSTATKSAAVISNENLPEQTALAGAGKSSSEASKKQESDSNSGDRADQIKSAILSQKNAIASLKEEIDSVSGSIHYAGGNCVANCAQWNEHQKEKQDEVDRMKTQLEEQQKHLEDMQDAARKEGFGSSVYEP